MPLYQQFRALHHKLFTRDPTGVEELSGVAVVRLSRESFVVWFLGQGIWRKFRMYALFIDESRIKLLGFFPGRIFGVVTRLHHSIAILQNSCDGFSTLR
ncbi:MAG: hypothetical protein JOZ60_14725 [Verrucomicrobia bacterium]|nr:hypothetical protein [Verrucomicrobiota bacterium]